MLFHLQHGWQQDTISFIDKNRPNLRNGEFGSVLQLLQMVDNGLEVTHTPTATHTHTNYDTHTNCHTHTHTHCVANPPPRDARTPPYARSCCLTVDAPVDEVAGGQRHH